MQKFVWVKCNDKQLRLSNLDKVLWPEEKITKRDLIYYYFKISPYLLKYLKDRPLTLRRCPNGIKGETFIQKQKPEFSPDWIKTFTHYSESMKKNIDYVVCNDLPTLIWLANLTNIEFNPTLSRIDKFDFPDWIVFDLDPFEPANFDDAKEIALIIRDGLKELKLKCWVKTSGASGLHIYVPIERNYTFEATRVFGSKIGSMIESLIPKKVTSSPLPLAERKGKVFIDPLQNSPTKTIVAPYSLRPLPKAPVSTPLEWKELEEDIKPTDFNINTIFERLEEKGDLFEGTLSFKQNLDKAMEELKINFRIQKVRS